jgi:hypothetical protein
MDGNFNGPNEVQTMNVAGNFFGQKTLTFDVPADAVTNMNIGARFRLSTDSNLGPDGLAPDGEVEDYILQVEPMVIIPGSIHAFGFEDKDADGIYDPSKGDQPWEQGLPGKVIVLQGDVDGDGNIDEIRQETNENGEVWFEDLTPGTYQLFEDLSVFGPDPATNHIMPSPGVTLPDGTTYPGGGDVRTVTITEGGELVWEPGAAEGMLGEGQFEVLDDPDGSGRNEKLMFGNFIKGSIHGFGFEDINADGLYEEGTDQPWTGPIAKKIDLFLDCLYHYQ